MNEEKSVMQEEHPTPAPPQNENDFGEGERTTFSGLKGLPYHPNRHDRRKAAAIARKEARKEGKK